MRHTAGSPGCTGPTSQGRQGERSGQHHGAQHLATQARAPASWGAGVCCEHHGSKHRAGSCASRSRVRVRVRRHHGVQSWALTAMEGNIWICRISPKFAARRARVRAGIMGFMSTVRTHRSMFAQLLALEASLSRPYDLTRALARRKQQRVRIAEHKAKQKPAVIPKADRPRCGARCRSRGGLPCEAPAVWDHGANRPRNGRCRLHGGLSTGPKTPEGRAQALAALRAARLARAVTGEPGAVGR
jgi:hypothetical protein